jgi:hypothetical protein
MTTASHPAFELNHSVSGLAHRLSRWLEARSAPTRASTASSIALAHHGTHSIASFQGGCIECTEGCVWLTHDGDCRDVCLQAGQSHVADRDCRLVIYAMAPSAVRLLPASPASR